MLKNSNFLASVRHATDGFLHAASCERNLRFHLCTANLICLFAGFFGISKTEWAILFIAIMAVLTAELFNTAIERAVDTATDDFCESAKHAKDASAAAVLVAAVFAIVCGTCLFGDFRKIQIALCKIFQFAFSGVLEFLILFAVLLFNVWLLFFCGRKKG